MIGTYEDLCCQTYLRATRCAKTCHVPYQRCTAQWSKRLFRLYAFCLSQSPRALFFAHPQAYGSKLARPGVRVEQSCRNGYDQSLSSVKRTTSFKSAVVNQGSQAVHLPEMELKCSTRCFRCQQEAYIGISAIGLLRMSRMICLRYAFDRMLSKCADRKLS